MSNINNFLDQALTELALNMPFGKLGNGAQKAFQAIKGDITAPVMDEKTNIFAKIATSMIEETANEFKDSIKAEMKPQAKEAIHYVKETLDNVAEYSIHSLQDLLKAITHAGSNLVDHILPEKVQNINYLVLEISDNMVDISGEMGIHLVKAMTGVGEKMALKQFDNGFDQAIEANFSDVINIVTGNGLDIMGDVTLDGLTV